MANREQLSTLKQGVKVWNEWRAKNHNVKIDLIDAYLFGADLSGAHLNGAYLHGAHLRGAHLRLAHLRMARLTGADLRDADLSDADLSEADLSEADLRKADLRDADLRKADLRDADLSEANLKRADLVEVYLGGADLTSAILHSTRLSNASLHNTRLTNLDLSRAIDLNEVMHYGPSSIGTDTLLKSKSQIPEFFLRGCGLSDWEIEQAKLYTPDLSNDEINAILYKVYDLRASQALQISPLFISYSHADSTFVDRLEVYLNKKGIRFWRDIHDMKAGRIETQVDRAIRQNPTVVLVLSKSSQKSDWVEHEVRVARELEEEMGRDVLCPVTLDDSWKSSPWPKRFLEQIMEYNILDFSEWQDEGEFEGIFRKLIDGLALFYKG